MRWLFPVLYFTVGINAVSMMLCLQDPKTRTIDVLERMVYAVATEKRVTPQVILNRILRKVKYRQKTEKAKSFNPLHEIALQELLNTKYRPSQFSEEDTSRFSSSRQSVPDSILPPLSAPPPRTPPSSQQRTPVHPIPGTGGLMTGVFFAPGFVSQDGTRSQPYPQSFYIPLQNLQPPPGVTIRVETTFSNDAIIPEVVVTLSPMMTIVEALKQAESKFRSHLGLMSASEENVMTFTRSSVEECYVIGSFNNIQSSDRGYWKVLVRDRGGKVIYDSVCLPTRNEVAVKPGMTITLLFILIE